MREANKKIFSIKNFYLYLKYFLLFPITEILSRMTYLICISKCYKLEGIILRFFKLQEVDRMGSSVK